MEHLPPLLTVKSQILTCDRCELHEQCRSPIPLTTTATPDFAVIGEAPGRWEDRRGEPFVGETGSLLRGTLKRAGLNPNNAAYFNAVSCWPKEDHNPLPHHIEACKDNLYAQLTLFPDLPVLICGRVALETLMPRVNPARARNRIIPWRGRLLYPVYHPSYIIRAGKSEYEIWKRKLMEFAQVVKHRNSLFHRPPTDCLYCGKPITVLIDEWVHICPKHLKKFRSDCEWHGTSASVTQTTLFE